MRKKLNWIISRNIKSINYKDIHEALSYTVFQVQGYNCGKIKPKMKNCCCYMTSTEGRPAVDILDKVRNYFKYCSWHELDES